MKKIKYFISLLCIFTLTIIFTVNTKEVKAEEWDGQMPSVVTSYDESAIPGQTFNLYVDFDFGTCQGYLSSITYLLYLSNIGEYDIKDAQTEWIYSIDDGTGNIEEVTYNDTVFNDAQYYHMSNVSEYTDDSAYQGYTAISIQLAMNLVEVRVEDLKSFRITIPVDVHTDASSNFKVHVYEEDFQNTIGISDYVNSAEWGEIYAPGLDGEVVVQAPSSEIGLDSVQVDSTLYGGTGSKTLDDLWNDGVEVTAETTEVSVIIDPKDTVTITGVTYTDSESNTQTVTEASGAYKITLNPAGSNTVVNIATKSQGTDTGSFTFTISRGQYNDTTLNGLAIGLPSSYTDGGKLGDFTYNKENDPQTYTLDVPEGLTGLDFTATVNSDTLVNSTIEVSDQDGNSLGTLTSGNKATINYDPEDVSSIILTVKAQDGTTEDYTIELDKLSDDTSLSSDGIKAYEIDADGNVTSKEISLTEDENTDDLYIGEVEYTGVTGFSVTASHSHADATTDFDPTSQQISFDTTAYEKTSETIKVKVTSKSGIEKIYTVKVTRKAASDDNSIDTVRIYSGTDGGTDYVPYTKSADSKDYIWIYEVPKSITTVTINIVATSTLADIKIGTTSKGDKITETHTNGSADDFVFTIYAEDKTVYQQYTIKVNKASETYNDIDDINILDKDGGDTLVDSDEKSLEFNKETTSERLEFNVPYSVSSIYLEAISGTTDNNATVYLMKGSSTPVSGKTTYGYLFTLDEGANTFTVYANSEAGQDGAKYTITITRAQGNEDASIKNLTIAGHPIIKNGTTATNITYDSSSNLYTLVLSRDDSQYDTILINTLELNASVAKATVDNDEYTKYSLSLAAGDDATITIVVKPEKGDAVNYKIRVSRQEQANTINNASISYKINNVKQTPITIVNASPANEYSVPFGATDIELIVETDAYHATVKLGSTELVNILDGTNNTVNYSTALSLFTTSRSFMITITSEFGVTSKNTITFKALQVEGDSDADLKELTVGGISLIENGIDNSEIVKDSTTGAYKVRFDRDVTKVDIVAEAEKNTSTITNDNNPTYQFTYSNFELTTGDMEPYTITVSAQNGDKKSYYIYIYSQEDKNTLDTVEVTYVEDGTAKNISIVDNNPDGYIIPYGATDIKLNVTADGYYANVTAGNGTNFTNLDDNDNPTLKYVSDLSLTTTFVEYKVSITSEYGTENSNQLTFKIKQEAGNTDASLKTLTVGDVEIIANGEITDSKYLDANGNYVIRFDRDKTSVNIFAETKETTSKITNTDDGNPASSTTFVNKALTIDGSVTYQIVVQPQNVGTLPTTYNVIISSKEDSNTISGIKVGYTDSTATPSNQYTQIYTSPTGGNYTVLSGQTNIKLIVVTDALYATVKAKYGLITDTVKTNTVTATNVDDDGNPLYEYTLVPSLQNGKTYVFEIEITSQYGTVNTTIWEYEITMPAGGSSSGGSSDPEKTNTISSISVIDSSNNEYFTFPSTTSITLDYNVGNVTINVNVDGTKGTNYIVIDGNQYTGTSKPLSLNQGDSANVTIYYISESGVKGTEYSFTISRNNPTQDSYLTSLEVNGTPITLISGKLVGYECYLDRTITSATITATACTDATITSISPASPIQNLKHGDKKIVTIKVTSQDPNYYSDYELTIYCGETKNTVTKVEVEYKVYGVLHKKELNLTTLDDIHVPYSATDIVIKPTCDGQYATSYIDPNNPIDPQVGTPEKCTVYYKSEIGVEGAHVNFNVVRDSASTNDYLKDLQVIVDGNNLIQFTDKEQLPYTIDNLDPKVLAVTILATAEHEYASVDGAGTNIDLTTAIVKGNTMVLNVNVYSEYQMTLPAGQRKARTYVIYISREKVDLSDNNTISSIIIKSGSEVFFASEFNINDNEYDVVLPYYVTNVDITASSPAAVLKFENSLNDLDFNFDFTIDYQLPLSVEVWAVSNLGNVGTKYKFNIVREEPDDDATLKDLTINTVTVSGFNPNKFKYPDIKVSYSVDNIDVAAIVNAVGKSTATITVDGVQTNGLNVPLTVDVTTFVTVTVTAQSGKTQIYTLSITRTSDAGSLDELYIEGVPFTDEHGNPISYDKNVYIYYATVSYAYESVIVVAKSMDPTIQIRGDGLAPLTVGPNTIPVDAIPRSGSVGRYTIIVTRKAEASDSTNVDYIKINEIDKFEVDYKDTLNIYGTYKVNSSISKLTFIINFETLQYQDPATYEIVNNDLHYGMNTVVVLITSSDHSTTRPIIVNVEREDIQITSANIKEINSFKTDFSNSKDSYAYSVRSNINKLNIELELSDPNASYEISDTTLKNGDNVIEIKLMNGEEVNRIIYLNVFKGTTSSISPLDFIMAGSAVVILICTFFLLRKKKRTI